jgi:hypothetical protein
MPRTGLKIYSSRMRKSSPLSSSTNTRMTRFMLKCPARQREVSKGVERPSPFLHHGLVGVSHQEVTSLHFCERGWKPVPKYIKRMCYKGL